MRRWLDLFRGLRPAGWLVLVLAAIVVAGFASLIVYAVSQ